MLISNGNNTVTTVPSFARVEIRIKQKDDLTAVADELVMLAGNLREIAEAQHANESAVILAHHKIRATSKRLRGT